VAEEALNRLSADLAASRSEGLKNYLAAMSRFRRYSWGNVLLISSQRPTATHVAGYHGWNQLGRSAIDTYPPDLIPALYEEYRRFS
jgi:hypothetical protein